METCVFGGSSWDLSIARYGWPLTTTTSPGWRVPGGIASSAGVSSGSDGGGRSGAGGAAPPPAADGVAGAQPGRGGSRLLYNRGGGGVGAPSVGAAEGGCGCVGVGGDIGDHGTIAPAPARALSSSC